MKVEYRLKEKELSPIFDFYVAKVNKTKERLIRAFVGGLLIVLGVSFMTSHFMGDDFKLNYISFTLIFILGGYVCYRYVPAKIIAEVHNIAAAKFIGKCFIDLGDTELIYGNEQFQETVKLDSLKLHHKGPLIRFITVDSELIAIPARALDNDQYELLLATFLPSLSLPK